MIVNTKYNMHIDLYQDIETLEYCGKIYFFPLVIAPSIRVSSITVESFGRIPPNAIIADVRLVNQWTFS